MGNTYLTTKGLSFKKIVIETLAYYMDIDKVKDI